MAAPTLSSGLSSTLRASQVLQKLWWRALKMHTSVALHTVTPAPHTRTAGGGEGATNTLTCRDRHVDTAYTPTVTDLKRLQKQT